jgi:hypothetical protein
MMLDDLESLLAVVPADASPDVYQAAIIDDNVLAKQTVSNRKKTYRHLSQLYALDPAVPIFRYLRFLWNGSRTDRALLAFLVAYARDPLLRLTREYMSDIDAGVTITRSDTEEVIEAEVPGRFSDAQRRSLAQNINGTWTEAGFLEGRVRKERRHPEASVAAVALALFLGYLEGRRAQRLFTTRWIQLLEQPPGAVEKLARQAARRGWLDYKAVGSVMEVRFPDQLSDEEEAWTHESH